MSDLLPCPFCGDNVEVLGNTDDVIGCLNDKCDVRPVASSSSSWNTRAPADGGWRPIDADTPRSTASQCKFGHKVNAIYLLGFCPDESITREACIDVVWWEPLTKGNDGKMGCWYGSGAMEVRPTHWMPLPQPPAEKDE